jgi:hypothetical protein
MVPTIQARLHSMIKALREAVLPALAPEHALAQEQGQLVLGSLQLILGQLDYAHAFEVVDARELSAQLAALSTDVTGAVDDDLQALCVRSDTLTEDPLTPLSALQALNHDLRGALTHVIDAIARIEAPERQYTFAHGYILENGKVHGLTDGALVVDRDGIWGAGFAATMTDIRGQQHRFHGAPVASGLWEC